MLFAFSKYSGCGNDFIIFDDRALMFPSTDKEQIKSLCQRKIGIGADGLILLQESSIADFRMRIFNADGSEAEMCGNGIRALMRFINELGFAQEACSIETLAGVLRVSVSAEHITVHMDAPKNVQWNLQLNINEQYFDVHFLDTGVPHVVHFTDNVETFDVQGLGKQFRQHATFAPHGSNFNVAHIADKKIWNRTYERGVEDETLACGTGCIAVALAAHQCCGLKSPITVVTRSKECMEVSFDSHKQFISNVRLAGPAVKIFEGSIFVSTVGSLEKIIHPGFSGLQFAQCN